MSALDAGRAIGLVGLGGLAGLIGTAGGITSLVSFPALLAFGLPAATANATNTVGLVTMGPASAAGSRGELKSWGSWLRSRMALVVPGCVIGTVLFLVTPSSDFGSVAPFLIAAAALVLLLQPVLVARRGPEPVRAPFMGAGLLLISIYDGYFGAGSGVMVLALMLVTMNERLAVANALKNVLLGVSTVVSAAILAGFGTVDWAAAGCVGIGALVGSRFGPSIARRIPEAPIRVVIGCAGLSFAGYLWFHG
jgi:uncharacterized membrane protein YfcA